LFLPSGLVHCNILSLRWVVINSMCSTEHTFGRRSTSRGISDEAVSRLSQSLIPPRQSAAPCLQQVHSPRKCRFSTQASLQGPPASTTATMRPEAVLPPGNKAQIGKRGAHHLKCKPGPYVLAGAITDPAQYTAHMYHTIANPFHRVKFSCGTQGWDGRRG
jgi:hypothetical protein